MSGRHAFRRFIACIVLPCYMVACSSWQTQELSPEQVIADEQPQKVQVKLTDGSELVLQQPTVSGDTLMGLEGDDQRHIPLADVSAIEVRRTDALLTTAFVFGTVVVVGAIAVGVAWAIYCSDTYDC